LAVVVRVAVVVALVDFVDFVVVLLLVTRKWMLSSVNFVSATVLLFLFRDSQSPRQLLGYKM
jgi:hypothetical protein